MGLCSFRKFPIVLCYMYAAAEPLYPTACNIAHTNALHVPARHEGRYGQVKSKVCHCYPLAMDMQIHRSILFLHLRPNFSRRKTIHSALLLIQQLIAREHVPKRYRPNNFTAFRVQFHRFKIILRSTLPQVKSSYAIVVNAKAVRPVEQMSLGPNPTGKLSPALVEGCIDPARGPHASPNLSYFPKGFRCCRRRRRRCSSWNYFRHCDVVTTGSS
mmetsp:Transcript_8796/g.17964  ORF Transcript_8796/g.17964 Transcript_8796/m.17964 type:complete len:215 (-) Transcript_8796:166-810(-)